MADYDNKSYRYTVKDLLDIQDTHNLSTIYLIKSKNGYNALSFDKLDLGYIFNINKLSSLIDKEFNLYNYNRKYYTLRFDYDKKLDAVLLKTYTGNKLSNAHRLFFNWFFDFKIPKKMGNFDNSTKIAVIKYHSNKSGYHIELKDV